MTKTLLMLLFFITFCSGSFAKEPQNQNVKYTSILETDCKAVSDNLNKQFDEQGISVQKCNGLFNIEILIADTGERSWPIFKIGKKLYSPANILTDKINIGYFPNISGKVIEWSVDENGKPIGVIFRIKAQNPENTEKLNNVLIVISLSSTPKYCGYSTKNDEAREILLNNNCSELLSEN